VATTEVGRPAARLTLAGSATVAVTVEVIYQSRATRMSQALLTMGVAVVIAPVLFFLPPHFLWPALALAGGAWLAWRCWKGEYYVIHFEGSCPRCATPLTLKRGARIRGHETLECYGCHRHPELVLDAVEE
jgi:hypothetical protein